MSTTIESHPQDAEPEQSTGERPGVGEHQGVNLGKDEESTSTDDHDDDGFGTMALMVRSFQLSKVLQVAAVLQLADRVAEGPCPVTRLASDCDADAGMLLRLCRALAAFGVAWPSTPSAAARPASNDPASESAGSHDNHTSRSVANGAGRDIASTSSAVLPSPGPPMTTLRRRSHRCARRSTNLSRGTSSAKVPGGRSRKGPLIAAG